MMDSTGKRISLTRRQVLVGGIGAALFLPRTVRAKASQPATPVNFDVPAGSCDCHTHIHGDPAKFPFFSGRVYTPETALPDEMAALHKALKMQRVVIVTPSVYGTDNSATLYGMQARGADARGVAVIDDTIPDSALDAMGRAGVRGIRLNLATAGINDPAVGRQRLQRAIERMQRRNWHVQINTNLAMVPPSRMWSPAPLSRSCSIISAAPRLARNGQPGFAELLELVRSGKAYVKISGAYRSSTLAPDYSDVVPLARALIAANPDRIVWGTDWPHPNSVTPPGRKPTDVTPLLQIDDGRLLNQLPVWAPDPLIRKKILVDNPARLYGF